MTKNDIMKAAFKVWGRDLYRTTSLSEIARELGVSKTALYRHFKDKDAISDAMFTSYFDEFTAFIKEDFDRAVSCHSNLIMMKIIAEYYIRNKDAFIFSLFRVFNSRDRNNVSKEFRIRGIDFKRLAGREKDNKFPTKINLIMTTVIFSVAQYHRGNEAKSAKTKTSPPEERLKRILNEIEERITRGLKLDKKAVSVMNFSDLERRVGSESMEETKYKKPENNALLMAVAEAVAEAGPWDASMEMVARCSGLSKSGLYAHFRNKQDMMTQFFITELSRLMNFAKRQIETSKVPEEQLYLAIISIVSYLRSRPEILMAMDYIKTMRLDLGKEAEKQLYKIISGIRLEAIQQQDRHFLVWIAQWILFLIVSTIAWWPQAKNAADIPDESFRILFRFIALGLEGIEK